jgi:hypothetical protein
MIVPYDDGMQRALSAQRGIQTKLRHDVHHSSDLVRNEARGMRGEKFALYMAGHEPDTSAVSLDHLVSTHVFLIQCLPPLRTQLFIYDSTVPLYYKYPK